MAKRTENRLVNTRTKFSCLIIDALDKEHFDSRQSYVVYRLADAQLTMYNAREHGSYNLEGPASSCIHL